MATRTYTPRVFTPAKTVEDLKYFSDEITRALAAAEERLFILEGAMPQLELLDRSEESLLSLPDLLTSHQVTADLSQESAENCNNAVEAVKDLVNGPEVSEVVGSYNNITVLKANMPALVLLAKSVEDLRLLNRSVDTLMLLRDSAPALEMINEYLEERKRFGWFKRLWNRFIENLKFRTA
jgi:hypothetical protein